MKTPGALKIFISYRHASADGRFLDRLNTHLASINASVAVWTDKSLQPGDSWRAEIENAINDADVGIVLISADALASRFIRDIEIPMLVAAHRQGRIRVIPLFVGPTSQLPQEIAALQGANSPDKPLIRLRRAQQEVVLADFVKLLVRHRPANGRPSGAPTPDGRPPPISLERVPATGLLFNRAEIRREITEFLNQPHRRVCIVHGFPGIGKTTLASAVVDEHRGSFADVFWLTCRTNEQPGLLLIGRIAAFLERQGDRRLQNLLGHLPELDASETDRLIEVAADGLSSDAYLLVLDDFHAYLGPDNELRDDVTRRLLSQLLRTSRTTKLLLLSDRRPFLPDATDGAPTGVTMEQELLGLPDNAVSELMAESGLPAIDPDVRRDISAHLAGNPALIKLFCGYVARRRLDARAALATVGTSGPVAKLISEVMADLTGDDRGTLERIAVLRAPLNWDELDHFRLASDEVLPLLDRWLVILDATRHSITVPPAIRDHVLQAATPAALQTAHRLAAAGYRQGHDATPQSYNEVRPLLEEGHHWLEAGDPEAAATAILSGVEPLITWGYADLALAEIAVVRRHQPTVGAQARCDLQEGRILDQRGDLTGAERCFRSSAKSAEAGGHERTLAHALFRLGRIHNARQEFADAEQTLLSCLAVCQRAGLGSPGAEAQLALAWGRKERGAPDDLVEADFTAALDLAEVQGDPETASDAHRQLGFFLWVRRHDRNSCEQHYQAAERIALEHSLAREIGAIHKELTYLATDWGDLNSAEQHARAGIESAEALGDRYLLPGAHANLARVYAARGNHGEAETLLERSIREFSDFGNRGGESHARHELGRLLAAHGEHKAALTELETAEQVAMDAGLILQADKIRTTAAQIRKQLVAGGDGDLP